MIWTGFLWIRLGTVGTVSGSTEDLEFLENLKDYLGSKERLLRGISFCCKSHLFSCCIPVLCGLYPTEATRLRFDKEKNHFTVTYWSTFFLIESQSLRLSGRTA
jgi:hypothetical protein